MLYLIEFIFYLLFFVFKLYSLIDSNYIFSAYGGKLRKYISKDNLSNITCNFGTTKINNFIQNFYSKKLKSLDSLIIKKFCIIFLIAFSIDFVISTIKPNSGEGISDYEDNRIARDNIICIEGEM